MSATPPVPLKLEVTVLPVSAAAARKYEAVDASGSMVRSAAR